MRQRFTRRAVLAGSTSAVVGVAVSSILSGAECERLAPLRERASFGIAHDPRTVHEFEMFLGYRFAAFGGAYFTFDTTWRRQGPVVAPASGRTLIAAWMPKSDVFDVSLSDISRGRYDAHIDQMLAGMRGFGTPVVCRFGYEMNGNWMPWSQAYPESRDTAGDFVSSWRYIVSRERQIPGASNIRWLWCASGVDRASPITGVVYPLEAYWPGDAWVDLVGCDVYNEPGEWESFNTVLAGPYERIAALSDKGFWVAETGCHEPSGDQVASKAQWMVDMLNTRRFPNLAAVCYFDYDARAIGRADWRLNSTAATFSAVQRLFRDVPAHPA